MLDEHQVIGVQEIGPLTRGRKVGVVIEDDVSRLILEGGEARLRQFAVGITLQLLFAQFIERIEVMRHDDQVRLVRATVQRKPQGVHVRLHGHGVCSRRRCGEVGPRHFLELVAPEGPSRSVDAAHGALTVGLDQVRKAVDLVRQRPVGIDIDGEVVRGGAKGIFLARLDEVDHLLFAAVHPQFAARSGDVQSDLLIRILDRGQHIGSARVQGFVTDVTLIGRVFRVVDGFGDFVTAGHGFNLALTLKRVQQGVVVAHVVGDFPAPSAVGRRHHFREHRRGGCHRSGFLICGRRGHRRLHRFPLRSSHAACPWCAPARLRIWL